MRALPAVAVAMVVLSGCGGKGTAAIGTARMRTVSLSPTERLYRVPSGSMAPTLPIGALVAVGPGEPRLGEIVIFHPPADAIDQACGNPPRTVRYGGAACDESGPRPADVKFVKRIVAGPGDTISIVGGHVVRNGRREADSYIKPCLPAQVPQCSFPTPIKVPAGEWFLLGDNRGESDDSRFWGPVPASWIVGVVSLAAPAK